MKIRKQISLVLCGTMCAVLLGACGQSAEVLTESAVSTEAVQEQSTQEDLTTSPETTEAQSANTEDATGEIGKVTAIDGDTITLVMADTPEGKGMSVDGEAPTDMEKPADGEAPADMEKPADGEAPTDMEKPADGEAPADMEKPADGEAPADMEKPADGGMGGNTEMQFTGEEQTITVTAATVITKDGDSTTLTLEDITVDSILRIVTDATSGEVTQIIIMN